jgi:hypothetical protein
MYMLGLSEVYAFYYTVCTRLAVGSIQYYTYLSFHTMCSTFPILLLCLQPLPRNIRNRNDKFDKNINKRGNVSIGKAAEHEDEFPVSKVLIAFFMVVVIGSSLVQVLNLFKTSAPPS